MPKMLGAETACFSSELAANSAEAPGAHAIYYGSLWRRRAQSDRPTSTLSPFRDKTAMSPALSGLNFAHPALHR